jgi:hypothetical protein
MNASFIRFTGWSAYLNAVATIAVIVTIVIFYSVGGLWGLINDMVSVVWVLSYLPLAIFLYQLNRPVNDRLSLLTAAAGILALLVFAALQTLLVLGFVRFEQTITAILAVSGVTGLWLFLNGLMSRSGKALPAGLARLTIAFGHRIMTIFVIHNFSRRYSHGNT